MDNLKRLRKYIIVTVTGIILTAFVCWLKDFSFELEKKMIYKILSDATFFTAVLLIGIGLLISIGNFGLFTAVSYSMKRFFTVFSRESVERRKNMPSYQEYRAVKLEHDVSGAFMYIPGVLFLVMSVIFTIQYY